MKKLIILSVLTFSMAFASCKKDFDCSCVTTTNGVAGPPVKTSLVSVTKKTAKANCINSSGTDGSGNSYTKDCQLN
ncbi:MAG TPA: hypothetical protein VN026_15815 [Bacteroidia bacterium]|jgi:hypothetical protein|nr:hypothetical protein [Bacteroidia bacterium]